MLATGAPLSEWLAWIETLSPKEIDLGLERVNRILDHLNLRRPDHVLLIAGTNGKGSSVAMASALLRAAGLRVGAYTSPHISRYNERIVVDGVDCSDAEIIAAFDEVLEPEETPVLQEERRNQLEHIDRRYADLARLFGQRNVELAAFEDFVLGKMM